MVFGGPDLENKYRRILSFHAKRRSIASAVSNLAENMDIIRQMAVFFATSRGGWDSWMIPSLDFLFYISMKKRYLNSNKGFA